MADSFSPKSEDPQNTQDELRRELQWLRQRLTQIEERLPQEPVKPPVIPPVSPPFPAPVQAVTPPIDWQTLVPPLPQSRTPITTQGAASTCRRKSGKRTAD